MKKKPALSGFRIIKGKKKRLSLIVTLSIILIAVTVVLVFHFSTPTGMYEYIQNNYALTVDSGDNSMVDPNATVEQFEGKSNAAFLLTNTYFEIFNSKGNNVLYFKHGFANPAMDVAEARILVFDRGGKNYKIFNFSTVLFEGSMQNKIISADLARNGKQAFVTLSNAYASELAVFNKDNKQLFVWNSSNILTDVSFNSDASLVAVSGVYTESGTLSSKVCIINASNGNVKHTLDFKGELISSLIEYSGKILAATENRIYVINCKNGEYSHIDLDGTISFIDVNKAGKLMVVYSRQDMQTYNNISIFSKKIELESSIVINAVLADIISDKDNIYAVYDNKMCIYDFDGNLMDTIKNEANVQRIDFVGNEILACGTSKIILLTE